jgi:hypothetical protein
LAEDIITIFSVSTAVFSIALAIFAIWQSNSARRETQDNSSHIGVVLTDIQANSDSIRENVSKNMKDMQSNIVETQKGFMEMQKTMTDVFTQRVIADIPQKVSPQDEFMMGLASQLFKDNPQLLTEIMKNSQQSQGMNTITNEVFPSNVSKEMNSDEKE